MLRSTLASIDDLVFVFDADLRLVAFDQPGEHQALYLSPQDFLGKRLDQAGMPAKVVELFQQATDQMRLERGAILRLPAGYA